MEWYIDDIPTVPGQTTSQGAGHKGDWVLFHPVYSKDELKAVKVLQHEPQNVPDRAAQIFVKSLRYVWWMIATFSVSPAILLSHV
jgi:hypothetical protein